MGSFDTGMRLGMQAWDTAQQNKRQKKLDERADKEYARKEKQWEAEDAAAAGLDELSTKGARNEGAIAANRTANQAGLDAAINSIGQGMKVVEPEYPALEQEYRPATEADYNLGLQNIARASKDWNAVGALRKEGKALAWDQKFGQRLKEYTGAEDQIGQAAQYVNTNSKLISMGDPDDKGVISMSVVKPDGRAAFMKLGKQDQAQLYAALGMVEDDPTRAMNIMAGVNKELAAAYAADNGIEFKMADVADKNAGRVETARHNKATEKNDAARTSAFVSSQGSKTSASNLREFVDAKGNTVILDVTEIPKDREGRLSIPSGLRPKTARPEYTQKDVMELAGMYVGQPDPDAPKTQMSPTRAMQLAKRELGGDAGRSVSDALIASLPMEDPRKAKTPGMRVTQSGSHSPPATTAVQQNPARNEQIREIDMRLGLRGISDETRLRLMEERQRLTGQRGGMGLQNWMN